jgi:hypothetical protein
VNIQPGITERERIAQQHYNGQLRELNGKGSPDWGASFIYADRKMARDAAIIRRGRSQ